MQGSAVSRTLRLQAVAVGTVWRWIMAGASEGTHRLHERPAVMQKLQRLLPGPQHGQTLEWRAAAALLRSCCFGSHRVPA